MQTDNTVTISKRDQVDSGKLSNVALVDRRNKYQTHMQNSSVLDEPATHQNDRQSMHSKDESQTNNTYGSKRRGTRRQRGDSALNTASADQLPTNEADLKRQGRRRLRQQRFQDDSDEDQTSQEKKKGYQSPSEKQYTLSSPNEKSQKGFDILKTSNE